MKAFVFLSLCFSLVSSNMCFAVSTHRISVSTGGVQADNNSTNAAISGDGRFVAFASDAANLVANDNNGVSDVFLHDFMLSTTVRISVSSLGEQSDGISLNPSLSHDGRYIAFESNASNLVAGDTNNATDIFLHDRVNGTTERVSLTNDLSEANMESFAPSVSADGRYIAYFSFADNIVANDSNFSDDIFVVDRQSNTTQRVSVDNNGVEGNGASLFPQLSADGRFVSFYSYADNLVAGDTNAGYDVFLYDRNSSTIERISVNSANMEADNHSFFSSVSADGRYVAFESAAANLAGNDSNRRTDVFLRDRLTQTTQRISLMPDGRSAMGASRTPRISADGSYVVFSSAADLLPDTDSNLRVDVYLYDISQNTLELVSIDSNDNPADYGSSDAAVSADGSMVVFQSMATNLVPDDSNAREDIFLRDRRPPNQPPVSKAGQDINIYLGEQVLLDASASFDPDGDSILTYAWNIEMAPAGSMAALTSSTTVNSSFTPDMIGDYVISLVVSDARDNSIADEIFVRVIENLPPVAVIAASPLAGEAPLTVQFDAGNSSDPENSPLGYAWNLGVAGAGSNAAAPVYTYTVPGIYNVVLTVEDSFGNSAETSVEIAVTANNEPPVVSPFTTTATQGPAPLSVSFVANASDANNDLLSYFWDFGDGFNSTEENPSHVFYEPGSYTVTVQVSDGVFTTSASLFVAVESALSIDVEEAELDFPGRQRSKGKLKLELQFSYDGALQEDDTIKIVLGDLTILEAPFNEFYRKKPGVYQYKHNNVYAKLDLNNHQLKVTKRIYSGAIPKTDQPLNVMVNFGQSMATDQIRIKRDEHSYANHRGHGEAHKSGRYRKYK